MEIKTDNYIVTFENNVVTIKKSSGYIKNKTELLRILPTLKKELDKVK